MQKYDRLWNEINTLLSYLNSSKVVDLVNENYLKYNNTAPGELLKEQIEKLQKRLDEADNPGGMCRRIDRHRDEFVLFE